MDNFNPWEQGLLPRDDDGSAGVGEKKIDDGGPAFPTVLHDYGMSLRDWFAGQALAGLAANTNGIYVHGEKKHDVDAYALAAYAMADAMLAERSKVK